MIDIKVEDKAVLAALANLQSVASGQGLQAAFQSIGETLVSNIKLGFKDQSDPWGNKWQSLSQTTRMLRAKKQAGAKAYTKNGKRTTHAFYAAMTGNMQILRDTGVLMNSINSQLVGNGVSVGSADKLGKALMHQFGGTTTGGRWAGRKIPARPFMPIRGNRVDLPNDWQADILDTVSRHILKAI
jgi:phage gpG-like protein